jgi:hypothetical protein
MERRRRIEIAFFRKNFTPLHLFLLGLFLIPAFMFHAGLPVKVSQVLLFALLAVLAGKRVKYLYFLMLIGSITAFNLLSPWGAVLFSLGPFVVTEGALEGGLLKGFTIAGLVFISLFSIRPELKIPGRLGSLLAKMFLYFERVLEGKKKVEPRRFIESVDEILTGLYKPGERAVAEEHAVGRTTAAGAAFIAVMLVLNYGLLAVLLFMNR